MTASQGSQHVEVALERIQSAADAIGGLDGVEQSWKTEAAQRLASVAALLRGTMDRFFLKTRVCLPFARKCEQTAVALEALSAQPPSDAQQQLAAALEALEKAARTLDERSLMQGMAIT